MSPSADLKRTIRELLETQPLAVLATQGEAGPHASLVGFAATEDCAQLFFATPRATRKFANLISDARVAFLVDNRTNQEVDFHEGVAATITGRAEELPPEDREDALGIYLARHPFLSEFVASPSCALFRVNVDEYSVVTRFQEVMNWRITP